MSGTFYNQRQQQQSETVDTWCKEEDRQPRLVSEVKKEPQCEYVMPIMAQNGTKLLLWDVATGIAVASATYLLNRMIWEPSAKLQQYFEQVLFAKKSNTTTKRFVRYPASKRISGLDSVNKRRRHNKLQQNPIKQPRSKQMKR
jgi:hypothetical protein